VARSSTTSDVFNAVAEAHRREILDVLIAGEKAVGAIVNDLSLSQPQVSSRPQTPPTTDPSTRAAA
jgi:DNA-binding transcriptional ArsR family regulator